MVTRVILVTVAVTLLPAAAFAQDVVERAQRLVEMYELVEAGQESREKLPGHLEAELGRLAGGLDRYLRDHADDVAALIAAARVARIQVSLTPLSWSPSAGEPPPTNETGHAHELLSRALAVEPDNADAHYWQARLYGLKNPVIQDGVIAYRAEDLDLAITHGRRAVELVPTSSGYRQALAMFLPDDLRHTEAIDVMRSVDGGQHPIYVLLTDMDLLGLPDEAVYLQLESQSFAEFLNNRGRFKNYPYLRTRVYSFPGSPAELEEALHRSWPDLEFDNGDAVFRTVNGGLEPSNEESRTTRSGYLSLAIEARSDEQERFEMQGVERFATVFIRNHRDVNR